MKKLALLLILIVTTAQLLLQIPEAKAFGSTTYPVGCKTAGGGRDADNLAGKSLNVFGTSSYGEWWFLGIVSSRFIGTGYEVTLQRPQGNGGGFLETKDCYAPLSAPEVLVEKPIPLVLGYGTFCHSTNVCMIIKNTSTELKVLNEPARYMTDAISATPGMVPGGYYIGTTKLRIPSGAADMDCLLTNDNIAIPSDGSQAIGIRSRGIFIGNLYQNGAGYVINNNGCKNSADPSIYAPVYFPSNTNVNYASVNIFDNTGTKLETQCFWEINTAYVQYIRCFVGKEGKISSGFSFNSGAAEDNLRNFFVSKFPGANVNLQVLVPTNN